MSSMIAVTDGQYTPGEEQARPVRNRLREAREWRKRLEPNWQLLLQFAAGKHWLAIDARDGRTICKISDLDARYRNRELYTADIISEYRDHVLGELGSDDDRPELLIQQDNVAAEKFQGQLNRALGYCWDYEADADEALAEVDALMVDLGTAGIRCRFDPGTGPVIGEVPFKDGQPLGDQAHEVMAGYDGGPVPGVEMRPVQEGRVTLEPLSAFNILVPPGMAREKYFPWEAVIRPTLLSSVMQDYGDAARGLKEDRDIGSTLGLGAKGEQSQSIRDHVWLTTYYERPTPRFPQGRVFHFAGSDYQLLRIDDSLPYQGPDGEYRSGVVYFHWRRVSGKFFSRGVVESLKESQRAKNEHRTTTREIIRRSAPYVLVPKGPAEAELKRTNRPMEVLPFTPGQGPPQPVQGIGPGPWTDVEDERIAQDAEHASGVKAVSLGENPAAVQTYGQLALLKQGDITKRQPAMRDRRQAIARMVEDMVYDMRTYWGDRKQVMLSPEGEQKVEADVFNATKIPTFFIVGVAKGVAAPRDQAAELVKVEQLFTQALNAGVVVSDPERWIKWYYDSIEHGQPLDLPENPADEHADKAELENHWLADGSREVVVASYDPPEVHIPIHRKGQIEAELAEDVAAWQRLDQHVQDHENAAAENALKMQAQQIATAHESANLAELTAIKSGRPMQPTEAGPQGLAAGAGAPASGGSSGNEPGGGGNSAAGGQHPPLSLGVPVNVHLPEPNIHVHPSPSNVHVEAGPAPNVHVEPKVHVGDREVSFQRDERGRITGASVSDKKKGKK